MPIRSPSRGFSLLWLAGTAACLPAAARAQASFTEGFESLAPTNFGLAGPQELTARGWIFRNQSQPLGPYAYAEADPGVNQAFPQAYEGFRYMMAVDQAADTGGALSAWAILPVVSGQRAGDVITLGINPRLTTSHLEIRYSPTGSVSTGTTATSTGDFSQVLADVTATSGSMNVWRPLSATVPGNGRLALRYTGLRPGIGELSNRVCIDSVSVGAPPAPPCNLPPLPAAGQTVHWTAAAPYVVCRSGEIPLGGTVIVDPGARIQFEEGKQLVVRGTIQFAGTASARIVTTATGNSPYHFQVQGGSITAAFTDFGTTVEPLHGSTLDLRDSQFVGRNSGVFSNLYVGAQFARVARTRFYQSYFVWSNATVVMDDVSLTDTQGIFNDAYQFVHNLSSDGQPIDFSGGLQPTFLDTVTVRNASYGMGLRAGNFLIGEHNTLERNGFPVNIYGHTAGGILPGSTLPATGNTSNMVRVAEGDLEDDITWADTGIPYYIAGSTLKFGGTLQILPGVDVQIAPNASFLAQAGGIVGLGTEDRPVTFSAALPGQIFRRLQLNRLRHGIVEGANEGLDVDVLESSLIRNNQHGALANTVRKTLFQNNDVALAANDAASQSNPNAFEGNRIDAMDEGDGRFSWWNSPTGPRTADNPGGSGDPVEPGVEFLPFLTARPDFSDAPPVVDLNEHSILARVGLPFVVTWDAHDDGRIVSQRITYNPDGQADSQLGDVVTLAQGLPGTQRAFEFVVPGPAQRLFRKGTLRVEATDDRGQIGISEVQLFPERETGGAFAFTNTPLGVLTAGQYWPVFCYTADRSRIGSGTQTYLLLENSNVWRAMGAYPAGPGCEQPPEVPRVSTDRARIVVAYDSGQQGPYEAQYFFSEPFSIRPDARVADLPPSVTITAPRVGSTILGGSVLDIRWTAADDYSLRGFDIQASYDGGRTWNFVARGIEAAARGYSLRLPPSQGLSRFAVKVIALDTFFQDSSSITQVSVLPGSCFGSADFNQDEDTGTDADIEAFFACLAGNCCATCPPNADFDGNGDVGTDSDIEAFFRVLAGGTC